MASQGRIPESTLAVGNIVVTLPNRASMQQQLKKLEQDNPHLYLSGAHVLLLDFAGEPKQYMGIMNILIGAFSIFCMNLRFAGVDSNEARRQGAEKVLNWAEILCYDPSVRRAALDALEPVLTEAIGRSR